MHICFLSPQEWAISEEGLNPEKNRISKIVGDLASVADRLNEKSPDIIFFKDFDQDQKFLDALHLVSQALSSAVLILVVKSPEPSFLINVMRSGVREVLASDSPQEISQALSRIREVSAPLRKSVDGKKIARRIGFMSAKGGDGGSFISANIASALAQDSDTRVLLVDLAIPFGDVEMYVTNEKTSNDLADIIDEVGRMDQALLSSMTHHVNDNFHFIPSPTSFEKIINLQPAQIDKLIDIAATDYDFLLVDIGTGFDPITLRTIEKLDQLFLVVTQSIPSIRRAGQIIRLLETLGFAMIKLSIIVNKFSSREPIGMSEVGSALRKKVALQFGADTEGVRESIVKGGSYLELFPKSDFTKAVNELAADWLGKPLEEGKSLWHRFGIK